MGDHAEDILDGSVCVICGEWLDDVIDGKEPPGYPRRCKRCRPKKKHHRGSHIGAAIARTSVRKGRAK